MKSKPKHNPWPNKIDYTSKWKPIPKRPHHGYCFMNQEGELEPLTFNVMEDLCWVKTGFCFDLSRRLPELKKKYQEAGCKVVKVRLEVVE